MQSSSYLLALDVGGRRIGLAIASSIAKIASPYKTLENNEEVFDRLKEIVASEDIGELVVGYPRNMEGSSTQQTVEIENFVKDLKKHIALPVAYQDESLTSHHAEEELKNKGVNYTKEDIDALAATYILQDYLNNEGVN